MKDGQIPQYSHGLIVGVTQSGKTTLAHATAWEEHDKKKDRRQIIVYDPVGTPTAVGTWPPGTVFFNDAYKFLVYLSKYRGKAIIFIDEADDLLSHRYADNTKLIRRGRHFGWQVILITQRPHLLSPSARTQCGVCFMFRLSKGDAKSIGEDFGHDGIHKIALDQGDFIILTSGHAHLERANVFKHSSGGLKWMDSGNISKSPSSS